MLVSSGFSGWVSGGFGFLALADDDVCGVSMPNSFQNDASMSVDLVVSLPESVRLPAGDLESCDDRDDREDLVPCTDNRLLLLEWELRLRDCEDGGAGERPRVSVPFIPSSPTVACLISSRNVHRPSRRSEAICFPVRIRASRLCGGIAFRHCADRSSGTGRWSSAVRKVGSVLRSTEGRVAARGTLEMRSGSGLPCSRSGVGLRYAESDVVDSKESVRACEPWNTLRPFADTELPAAAAGRILWRRSRSRLTRADAAVSGIAATLWLRRWDGSSTEVLSGDFSGSKGSA